MKRYSRTRNYGDHDADNLTIGDQHLTQPTDRRAELWQAWREMRARNEAWLKGVEGQHDQLPVTAINNYHEIKLIEHETGI